MALPAALVVGALEVALREGFFALPLGAAAGRFVPDAFFALTFVMSDLLSGANRREVSNASFSPYSDEI